MSTGGRPRIRVLVAEDSDVVRRLLVHMLSADPEIEVVGEATDGLTAVELTKRLRPDVITMDVHMPKLDGMEATRVIMEEAATPIVVVSASWDPADKQRTFQTLEAGALALVEKPEAPTTPGSTEQAAHLVETVKVMAGIRVVTRRRRPELRPVPRFELPPDGRIDVVAMAASTGGPPALASILGALSPDVPVPVLVVQHMTAGFHQGLIDWLGTVSALPVALAVHGRDLDRGRVYVAPHDLHMGVSSDGRRIALSQADPIAGHRPSATHLFRSVAAAFREHTLAVVLSGMGQDGLAGLSDVKAAGGIVLAQDEATSAVYGMPRAAVEGGLVEKGLPLGVLAGYLPTILARGRGLEERRT